jgi:steroid 5-alpha reductase family enzyme
MSPPTIALVALGAVLAMMSMVWVGSLVTRNAGIIDVFWGLGFVGLAWLYLWLTDASTARAYLVVTLVSLWGLRLALYILWRNWGHEEDYRYRAMRERNPTSFPWRSLITVFWLQAVLLWGISLPLFQAARSATPPSLRWLDVLGVALFIIGFVFEAGGDWQLARFKADPANRGAMLDRGLWRYTRHPNYFGDAMIWWGFFCFAAATPGSLWTIYSPILMTVLLMKVSGVALLEQRLTSVKPGYHDYVSRTNAFLPWLPRRKR